MAPESPRGGAPPSLTRAFLLGLATQLSNPKAAVVYAAIFATFLPQGTTLPIGIALVVLVFLLETSWYSLVTLVMSSAGPVRPICAARPGSTAWLAG